MADEPRIRGLTVIQPWAWYIARGPKRIENRTWSPSQRLVGGYLAIHAGKKLDADIIADAREFFVDLCDRGLARVDDVAPGQVRDLPLGAVVAVARLAGWVTESDDPWFVGPIGWQLADVVAIEPVTCRGAQGLWTLPPDVLELVRARWKEARAS